MQQFPKLKDNQVALMRAEFNTGIVLDENFLRSTSDTQILYTIFDDAEAAITFAKEVLETKSEFEFIIYGKDKNVIHYITPVQST